MLRLADRGAGRPRVGDRARRGRDGRPGAPCTRTAPTRSRRRYAPGWTPAAPPRPTSGPWWRRSRTAAGPRRSRSRGRPRSPSRRSCATASPPCSAASPCCRPAAGHDAGILADAGVEAAMLFVRNPTGVSHSPAEHAEDDDCDAGVEALADVLADLTAPGRPRRRDDLPRRPRVAAARPARPRRHPRRRGRRSWRGARGRAAAPAPSTSAGSSSPASRTRTPTLSTGRCAAGPSTAPAARARSGPGASRCTAWPAGSTRTATWRWPARRTARWCWPASRPSASSTTCTTHPAAPPTTTPTPWGTRWSQAARDAGLRIALLDTCYLAGGIGEPLAGVQQRFGDGDADGWAARADALRAAYADDPTSWSAPRCTRCAPCPADQLPPSPPGRRGTEAPLHVHVSEQRARERRLPGALRRHADPAAARPRRARAAARPCTRPT